ncbi:MAG: hypothetical protein ACTHMQ_12555 [Protaetiibacter sp.]
MVEKEHRTRDGTLVEPGELAAKERQHARRGGARATPTLPLPVIPPKAKPAEGDADAAREGDPPPV